MKKFIDTYKPLPEGLTIKDSKVHGLGLFTTKAFPAGTDFGETHVFMVNKNRRDWVRTPLGGFINHSEEPNAKIVEVQRVRYLYFLRDIQDGEEITVKYSMYDPTQLS